MLIFLSKTDFLGQNYSFLPPRLAWLQPFLPRFFLFLTVLFILKWPFLGVNMITLRVESGHSGGNTSLIFVCNSDFSSKRHACVCSMQGFLRLEDSKMREKQAFCEMLAPEPICNGSYGLKCERGKKILKRWGFSGIRKWENRHSTLIFLTYINMLARVVMGQW